MTATLEETTLSLRTTLPPADAEKLANRLHTAAELQLQKLNPTATAQIQAADKEAVEAQERAETLRMARAQKFQSLKDQILALGTLREKIAALLTLRVAPDSLAEQAVKAYVFFLESPSPNSESAWQAALDRASRLPVIQEQLKKVIGQFEREAQQNTEEIRASATAERIDLDGFISDLRLSSGLQPATRESAAHIGDQRLNKLFCDGFIEL